MMTDIRVRSIGASDLPQLIGLDHSSSTEHVWQLEMRREPQARNLTVAFREVRLPRSVALIYPNDPNTLADEWKHRILMKAAVSGSEVLGYLSLQKIRPTVGLVADLVVAPKWRRQGIAGALLSTAQEWGTEKKYHSLILEMQSKNYPGIKLAHKHGYEFCGYNDHYYSTQDIALFFAKML